VAQFEVRLYLFCLMRNHLHLVLETGNWGHPYRVPVKYKNIFSANPGTLYYFRGGT
jgi:hypothetical protein